MSKAPAIGIDLGTTRSRAAVFRNGRVEVIHTDLDSPYMSNVVGYARTKFEGRPSENEDSFTSERVIGHYASELAGEKDACNKVFNIKRILGRSYDATVASDSKYVPFTVLSCSYDPHWPQFNFNFHGSEKPMVKLCSNDVHQGVRSSYYPEEISAMLLGKIKEAAERHLGMPVTDAVISVPACFNDAQRQATLDAAAIAGLNVLRLINDPTAVAIQYYREKEPSDPRKVLIFNLGGGTCEVSNVAVGEDGIALTSSVGESHLGGEDFVDALMEYAFRGIDQRKKNSLHRLDPSDVDWMRRSCKRTMCSLSSFERAELEIESLSCKIMYTESLTRKKFEELNSGLFDRISTLLSKAGNGFEGVIMVGHSSAIPKVQTLLKKRLKVKGFVNFENPGVSVAQGAAIMAAKLQGDKTTGLPEVAEILSRSLCYKFFGEKTKDLVEKNIHYIPFSTIKKYQFRSNEEDRYAIVEEYEDSDKTKKRTIGKFDIVGPFDESIFKEMCKRGRGRPVIDVEFCVDWNGVLQVSAQTVGDTFRIFPYKCRRFREDQIDILEYHFLAHPSEEEKERIRDIVKNSLEYFLSTCPKTEKSDKLKEWFDANQMKASTDQFREKLWRFNAAYK